MEHQLKTWPPFFEAISDGRKTFEVRKNDRGFNAGDVLWLREYDPNADVYGREERKYTGNEMRMLVTYVLSGEGFGVKDGYVVMGIKPVEESDG